MIREKDRLLLRPRQIAFFPARNAIPKMNKAVSKKGRFRTIFGYGIAVFRMKNRF
jgi:hypothetical protein